MTQNDEYIKYFRLPNGPREKLRKHLNLADCKSNRNAQKDAHKFTNQTGKTNHLLFFTFAVAARGPGGGQIFRDYSLTSETRSPRLV